MLTLVETSRDLRLLIIVISQSMDTGLTSFE